MTEVDTKVVIKVTEEGVTTTTTKINGLTRSIAQVEKTSNGMTRTMVTFRDATQKTSSALWQQTKMLLGVVSVTVIAHRAYAEMKKIVEESIKGFREFEIRIAEVSTILDETGMKQLPLLTAGVERLSVAFGQTTSDMAKGLYDILSAAFSARDAINLLNTATKASIAGLSTVKESVDIFTTVLNSYGMSAEQATHVSDILFQSVIRGKFVFKELESAIGYVVPIASQAGISLEELMAALSTSTRHGLHLDMASRGLALAIQGIINPTTDAAKAAEKYGIDLSGLGLRADGLYKWFERLNEKTKEFGKGILPEVVKNMRSLRIAMVLAGEEGIQGFADDLRYLEGAAGRTEEALAKMMETQQFQANQLREQLALVERDWGDWWGGVELAAKRVILSFVAPKNIGIGETLRNMYPVSDEELENIKTRLKLLQDLEDEEEFIANARKQFEADYHTQDISSVKYRRLPTPSDADILRETQALLDETQDAWNNWKGAIDDAAESIGNLELVIFDLERDVDRLNTELNKPFLWGMNKQFDTFGSLNYELEYLQARQDEADISHDIQQGLKAEDYEWKTHIDGLKEAVDYVREYEQAQRQNTEAMQASTLAMRQNNIEMMKLQLKGMQRRRGLTRSETQRMKQLQISNLEIRIAAEETQKSTTQLEYENYLTYKKTIEDQERIAKEHAYQMGYTWDSERTELEDHIGWEQKLLTIRNTQWDTSFTNLTSMIQEHVTRLVDVMNDPELLKSASFFGIDIPGMLSSVAMRAKEFGMDVSQPATSGSISPYTPAQQRGIRQLTGQYQQGTYYVPRTGPAMVHKGEEIVPSGSQRGGGTISATINVNVAEIHNHSDIEALGAQLAVAIKSELVGADGVSKYGLR